MLPLTPIDGSNPYWPQLLLSRFATEDLLVIDNFLPQATSLALLAEANQLKEQLRFQPARIGTIKTQSLDQRGDEIYWWDLNQLSSIQHSYFQAMETLKAHLNQRHYLGLDHYEAHYAKYEIGRGYERHFDTFRDRKSRVLSTVFYLNADWPSDAGGEFVWHSSRGMYGVLPTLGRLVIFLSERVEHQVLPARLTRWSLTGWWHTQLTHCAPLD